MTGPLVVVVSSGRPGNVPAMEEHLRGLAPTWYVPEGQAGDYVYAGAAAVVAVPVPAGHHGVVWQRNAALDAAQEAGRPLVMTDDDLRRCAITRPGADNAKTEIPAAEAVRLLVSQTAQAGLHYGGAAPTDNAYFCRRPHTTTAFIRAGFTCHLDSPLRHDPRLPLKEDYDMTLQHLAAYGGALRLDTLLMTYQQRARKGGCDYRTPQLEEACIDYLLAKWPGQVRRHARRPHEVTITWKG